jgi:hypothetical protein
VGDDVVVGCTARVMTWEDGLELNDTIIIGLLNPAQEGGVDVGSISSVTVAIADNTRVDTSRIAVPDIKPDVGDGLAGLNVNELGIESDINTWLVFSQVGAHVFARDVEGADFTLRVEDTGGVVCEDDGLGGVDGDATVSHLMGLVEDSFGVADCEPLAKQIAAESFDSFAATSFSTVIVTASFEVASTFLETSANRGLILSLLDKGDLVPLFMLTRVC